MANNIAYSNRLEFTQGSSFKEYNVAIITAADDSLDLFNVNFSYGRIGSALQTGTKNASPVTLSEAESIAQKLIKSKMKKGYVSVTIVDNIPAFQSGQSSTSNAVAVKDISFDDVNNPAAQHQVVPSAVSQMIDNLKSDPQYTPVFPPHQSKPLPSSRMDGLIRFSCKSRLMVSAVPSVLKVASWKPITSVVVSRHCQRL